MLQLVQASIPNPALNLIWPTAGFRPLSANPNPYLHVGRTGCWWSLSGFSARLPVGNRHCQWRVNACGLGGGCFRWFLSGVGGLVALRFQLVALGFNPPPSIGQGWFLVLLPSLSGSRVGFFSFVVVSLMELWRFLVGLALWDKKRPHSYAQQVG